MDTDNKNIEHEVLNELVRTLTDEQLQMLMNSYCIDILCEFNQYELMKKEQDFHYLIQRCIDKDRFAVVIDGLYSSIIGLVDGLEFKQFQNLESGDGDCNEKH